MKDKSNAELRSMIEVKVKHASPAVRGLVNDEAKYATKSRLKHMYTHLRVTTHGDVDYTKKQRDI